MCQNTRCSFGVVKLFVMITKTWLTSAIFTDPTPATKAALDKSTQTEITMADTRSWFYFLGCELFYFFPHYYFHTNCYTVEIIF